MPLKHWSLKRKSLSKSVIPASEFYYMLTYVTSQDAEIDRILKAFRLDA
jgi:hypothetical protein